MLTVLSFFSLAQIVAPVPVPPAPSTPAPPPAIEAPAERPTSVQQPSSNLPNTPVLIPPIQPPIVTPPPVTPPVRQVELVRSQEVRPLPGQLDEVPVFNSNSPEIIQTDGILLSTFPADGMRSSEAHLNYPLEGRFDLFAHHIAKGVTAEDDRTPFLGVIVYNPSNEPVTLDILQAVSYLSQEAPFVDLPSYVGNPLGNVFAGPGSRTTNDVLRGQRQPHWPAQIIIPPRRSQLLINVPIPLRRLTVATNGTLPPGYIIPPAVAAASTPATASRGAASLAGTVPTGAPNTATEVAASSNSPSSSSPASRPPSNRTPPSNGRTVLMHLSSSGPVYLASLAMYAPKVIGGGERVPSLQDWEALLRNGSLAVPRDRNPTPPDARAFLRFFYGRVAGVAQGSQWTALATDGDGVEHLSIPRPGEEFSYVISTVDHNTFGTGQIQSAPMLVRYPDTAYRAHGNYGIKYDISMPLYNHTDSTQRVAILLQTPVQDEGLDSGLRFREPPDNQVFFRGTVRLRFTDDFGIPQTRYLHIVQRRGQQGEPLLRLTMPPGERRLVEVQFIYPPDSTPPQVLTVQTQGNPEIIEVSNE
jgi:hypothetical protein